MHLFSPDRPRLNGNPTGHPMLLQCSCVVPMPSIHFNESGFPVSLAFLVPTSWNGFSYRYLECEDEDVPDFILEYRCDPEAFLSKYFDWRAPKFPAPMTKLSQIKGAPTSLEDLA